LRSPSIWRRHTAFIQSSNAELPMFALASVPKQRRQLGSHFFYCFVCAMPEALRVAHFPVDDGRRAGTSDIETTRQLGW